MATLFRQIGIYSSIGRLYEPQDAGSMLYYKEATNGQLLEEGITEAGALPSWVAAATFYSTHGLATLPSVSSTRCSDFSGSAISSGRRPTSALRRPQSSPISLPAGEASTIAASDYVCAYPQLVAAYVEGSFCRPWNGWLWP
jgi:hypothetical protein